jgi:Fic family protein
MALPAPQNTQLYLVACQRYDEFQEHLIRAHKQDITSDIYQILDRNYYPNMSNQSKFQQVDKLKSWLDSFRPLSPIVVAELKKLYDVQFTYNSNAIEGNTLSMSETELVLTTGITIGGKTLQEHLEVVGHKDAIDYIEMLARQDTKIGEREIKQIHNLIIRAIAPEEAGRYRQLDVKAAGTNYLYPPHYLLPQLMAGFIDWLNSEQALSLHPVEYATIAHFRFVSIHPFRDGNGRTARLIMNLLLIKAGYPIVIISNSERNDYINSLAYGQSNQNDISQFLTIILDATKSSLVETLRLLATAADSRGKGMPFYEEMISFLKSC